MFWVQIFFEKSIDWGKALVFADRRFPLNKFNIVLEKVKSSYIYRVLVKVQYMRKTLWPLAWSPSTNKALKGPIFRNVLTGFDNLLQVAGNQRDISLNQLQDQFHRA